MHVRVRLCGKPEIIVVVPSKLTKIEAFRKLLDEKFGLEPSLQRLLYGGKLLDDGFSFHDYNIKMNDVIQLMKKIAPPPESEKSDEDSKSDDAEDKAEPKPIRYIDAPSRLYRVGDLVDVRERVHNAWFEGRIIQIVKDPEYISKSKPQTSKSNGSPKKSTRNSLNKNDTAKSSPVKKTPERKAKTSDKKENGLSNSSKKENGLNTPSNSSEKENGLNTPSNSSKKENGLNKSSNSGKKENGVDKIDLNSSSTKSSLSPKNKSPKRGITDYFSKGKVTQPSPNGSSKRESKENGHSNDVEMKIEDDEKIAVNGKCDETNGTSDEVKSDQEFVHDDSDEEVGLLYKAHFDEEEETSLQYCKLSEIRPRAKKEIDVDDLKTNQTVLLNYNIEEPHEKGFWYDFTVHEVKKLRKNTELIGTLFHGKDVPLHNVKVKLQDKVYAIETVIPLNKRSTEYEKSMITPTEKSPKEKKNTQEDQSDSCSEESWVSSDNFEGDFSDNDSYDDPNFDPTSGEDSESEEDVSFNKRGSGPLVCTKCRDAPGVSCKECGCNICSGKNQPETIILCDECNQGYHMTCLTPALSDLPTEDWYCADCKRDPASVVAPGGKVQKRKPNQHKARDWGRGMACQGKTTTCAMPANHFGPIPGIEVGMAWRFRIQLSESGVHRPPVSGIHGRDVEGAYSIVLSGGYEDDVDHGFEFTYTGSGGRDLSGNKRTADQSSDQTLTRENKALARNCAVKEVKEEGGDSQEKWRDGRPVRVVRSYKMIKHFPEYAPKEGIRYDGIYKVVKYYPEKGKSGFRVWKYLLRRDDPTPAPWEAKGKMFPIIYPDGYLEAEAEKQAQKERDRVKSGKTPVAKKAQKRPLRESNGAVESEEEEEVDKTKKQKAKGAKDKDDTSPPKKKMKTRSSVAEVKEEKPVVKTPKATPRSATTTPKRKKLVKTEKISSPSSVNPFTLAANKKTKPTNDENAKVEIVLSPEDRKTIEEDSANKKLWEQCLDALEKDGKKGLVDKVAEVFLCIICQDVPANPVTTSCSHNFCMSCLKLAFKSNEANICPACRNDLSKEEITHNELLKTVLLTIMPGYDTRKK